MTKISGLLSHAEDIENAINSVIHETYPEIEYIIIDGSSEDNTKASEFKSILSDSLA